MAAVTGALVAETAIRFLHGDHQLSGNLVALDATTWRTSRLTLARDPECARAHQRIDAITPLAVRADDTVTKLFDALADVKEPHLLLPAAFIISMPCVRCGHPVRVGKPEWAVNAAPSCTSCEQGAADGAAITIEQCSAVTRESPLARASLRKLGLAPRAVVEVFDGATRSSSWVQLAGSLDDLFVTRRREVRERTCNADAEPGMNQTNTEEDFRVLDTNEETTP
jgi:hypothetical protein